MGVDLYDDLLGAARGPRGHGPGHARWTAGPTEGWLADTLTWTSGVDGATRTQSCWLLASHLFNQQTRHRGQLTTLLCQLGYDVGSTDLPWMPHR
jgi:uncharacterized damage-inducible protein DinB